MICYSFEDFSNELIRVLDCLLPEREAAQGLLSIKEGNKRVSNYIIDFHTLATNSKWNTDALWDGIYQGLSEEIKNEIATRDPPKTQEELESLATRIDLRLHERRRERGRPSFQSHHSSSAMVRSPPAAVSMPPSPGPSQPEEEPMQLGRTKLTPQERLRRLQNHLCFCCGGEAHIVSNCLLKAKVSTEPDSWTEILLLNTHQDAGPFSNPTNIHKSIH